MIESLVIANPKRDVSSRAGRASWYPYYAGFSPSFAQELIASADLPAGSKVLDPWNGSGTTTSAAAALGYTAIGYDLNPVMTIVAKARTLSKREKPSIAPLTADIVRKSSQIAIAGVVDDPLGNWLVESSAAHLRRLEQSVQLLLIDANRYRTLVSRDNYSGLSNLAAFFYTALFRVVRSQLRAFEATNPTWTKKPRANDHRISLSNAEIISSLEAEVTEMMNGIDQWNDHPESSEVEISVASSEGLPVPDQSINLILGSPPYCTRIDYAMATVLELAVLGYEFHGSFEDLRRSMMGTATVPSKSKSPMEEWGETCCTFLDRVFLHDSKASRTYYYKSHVQYFDSMFRSVQELRRVLSPTGSVVIVVQDSHYKEIHNDLPEIVVEMASSAGLRLGRREDFRLRRTMARINPEVRKYRSEAAATESVLCFTAH